MNTAVVLLALQLLHLDPTTAVTVVDQPYDHRRGVEVLAWVDVVQHPGVVFVGSYTSVYRRAAAGKPDDLKMLAALIAHERCHLEQTTLEELPCYDVELRVLRELHASPRQIEGVVQSRLMFTF